MKQFEVWERVFWYYSMKSILAKNETIAELKRRLIAPYIYASMYEGVYICMYESINSHVCVNASLSYSTYSSY